MEQDDIYDKIVEQLRYDLTAEEYKELIGLEYTSSQGFATDEEIERYKFLSNKRNSPYFKEETLEEAAENFIQSYFPQWTPYHKESFKKGAKWQEERMYTREDMFLFAGFVSG